MNTMTTKTKPARLAMRRGPYRIVWHGGEYAEVHAPGFDYAIEVINMTRPDGTLPEMSREVLRAEVDDEDTDSWDATVSEMRRFPVAGAR